MPLTSLRKYYSPLGLKVAVLIGVLLMVSTVGYRALDGGDALSSLYDPVFWAWIAAGFLVAVTVMSWLVVMPLKRLHLGLVAMEAGEAPGPLPTRRRDEIGVLAARVDTVNRLAADEIKARTIQLSALNKFINAASGVVDPEELMRRFFNTLADAVEFEAGAYALCHRNHMEGGLFSAREGLDYEAMRHIREHMNEWMSGAAAATPFDWMEVGFERLETVRSGGASGLRTDLPMDRPIVCFGSDIGVVSLFFRTDVAHGKNDAMRVYDSMMGHVRVVMERLLIHMMADERRLQDILESISEGVFILDSRGVVTSVNGKGEGLINEFCRSGFRCFDVGIDQGACNWPNKRACVFRTLSERVKFLGRAIEGRAYAEEMTFENGKTFHFSVSRLRRDGGTPEGYVITAKDVTADRLIQKRLALTSKLAALGEMAAGVTHEINNPLQVMMTKAEVLEKRLGGEAAKGLDVIRDSIVRIKGIVQNLLMFAKDQPADAAEIEANSVVERVIDMERYRFRVENIKIEFNPRPEPIYLKCNKHLLQQVLVNLLNNAKDAITGSGKGSGVYVRTALLPNESISIKVADDGPGIPEDVVDRIFDPFFTTKDAEHGTGLGLSVSKRFIEQMGGEISVASMRGWTEFSIILPRTKQRDGRDETGADAVEQELLRKIEKKSVLIIDDEVEVLVAVREALAPFISVVDGATEGAAALEKIGMRKYEAVLVDIKMPGVNGMALFRAISESRPEAARRVIFMTGDTKSEETREFMASAGRPRLHKPFALRELIEAISAIGD